VKLEELKIRLLAAIEELEARLTSDEAAARIQHLQDYCDRLEADRDARAEAMDACPRCCNWEPPQLV